MSEKKVKYLGQITDWNETIKGWEKQYDKRDDKYYCYKCGGLIKQTLCYVSIHLKIFEPTCAGPGKVLKINFPFCPNCDADLEYVTACYHF